MLSMHIERACSGNALVTAASLRQERLALIVHDTALDDPGPDRAICPNQLPPALAQPCMLLAAVRVHEHEASRPARCDRCHLPVLPLDLVACYDLP